MTTLGPTAIAGDGSGAGGESTFNEFIGFVERFASPLNRVVSDLSRARKLDPALRNALTDVLATERIDQLVSEIGSRLEGLNEDRRTERADQSAR
jgi:hypothetical protein